MKWICLRDKAIHIKKCRNEKIRNGGGTKEERERERTKNTIHLKQQRTEQ